MRPTPCSIPGGSPGPSSNRNPDRLTTLFSSLAQAHSNVHTFTSRTPVSKDPQVWFYSSPHPHNFWPPVDPLYTFTECNANDSLPRLFSDASVPDAAFFPSSSQRQPDSKSQPQIDEPVASPALDQRDSWLNLKRLPEFPRWDVRKYCIDTCLPFIQLSRSEIVISVLNVVLALQYRFCATQPGRRLELNCHESICFLDDLGDVAVADGCTSKVAFAIAVRVD